MHIEEMHSYRRLQHIIGGEDDALREVLGSLGGFVPGKDGSEGVKEEDSGSTGAASNIIPVENVVDELVAWLDEGSL